MPYQFMFTTVNENRDVRRRLTIMSDLRETEEVASVSLSAVMLFVLCPSRGVCMRKNVALATVISLLL